MLVAIPTAIPEEPLTSRFGNRAGRTSGSCVRLVVVGAEVDGVGVDVAQHLGREAGEAGLGVPHRGGGVVVDRAEVALAVDQRVAQREVLRHPDQRVVDRRVAVRVVLAHHLADDEGALAVGPGRLQAEVVHRVEHAAVDRLQAVAHVGQRPADDHAHRVIEVRASASPARARAPRCARSGRRAPSAFHRSRGSDLDIEEPHLLRVRLDEAPCAARPCRPSGRRRSARRRPRRRASPAAASARRVHRRLAQLVGVHLAEALEALQRDALPGQLEDRAAQRLERERASRRLLAERDLERRPADLLQQLRVDLDELAVVVAT